MHMCGEVDAETPLAERLVGRKSSFYEANALTCCIGKLRDMRSQVVLTTGLVIFSYLAVSLRCPSGKVSPAPALEWCNTQPWHVCCMGRGGKRLV